MHRASRTAPLASVKTMSKPDSATRAPLGACAQSEAGRSTPINAAGTGAQ
jgi:hypothetical protein